MSLTSPGLYVSHVLATAYHAVSRTGVQKGDSVAIWGLGPIGLMACAYASKEGAERTIGVDINWRTDYARSELTKLETVNYAKFNKQTVTDKIHEVVPGGMNVAIEASGGEYGKGWMHSIELAVGTGTDTSEMINGCITSTRKFGKVGNIADYVRCKSSAPISIMTKTWS